MTPRLLPRSSTVAARLLLACTLLAGALLALPASALPRMSLLAGSRCSNCHVNPQGSGQRSDLGWYSMNQVGLATWDKLGWNGLHAVESNTLYDGKLLLGFDYRGQLAKLGRPVQDGTKVKEPDRRYIPMQLSPSFAWLPSSQWTLSASANLLSLPTEFDETGSFRRYPGQAHGEAWVRWQHEFTLPWLRAGLLQPGVGVRHDDHTMLLRADATSPRQPQIAPFWNDPGLEIGWEGLHWLSVDASVFLSRHLYRSLPNVGRDAPGFSGRLTLWPHLPDVGLMSWLGASALHVDDTTLLTGYFGVGKAYWGTFMAEVSRTAAGDDRETLNYMAMATWAAADWLSVEGRAEHAETTVRGDKTTAVDQFVLGVQFFPVPFLELRPEYRYLSTDEYTLGQYTLQTHIFF